MSNPYLGTERLLRSRLELWPAKGKTAELVHYFKRNRIIERAMGMRLCIHGVMLTPIYDNSPVVIEALWRHEEDYSEWQEYATRNHVARIAHLLDGDKQSKRHLCEVAHIAES